MKKVLNYLKAQEAKSIEMREARKARFAAMSKRRKVAYFGVFALIALIAAIGILTKTIHTASFIIIILALTAPQIITRPPNLRRKLAFSLLLSPPAIFCLAIALGAFSIDIDYESARADQQSLRAHPEEVRKDAEQFQQNYMYGTAQTRANLPSEHSIVKLGQNDKIGYMMAQKVFGLIHLRAPNDVDVAAILPFADLLFADQTFILFDKQIFKRHSDANHARLAAKYDIPADEISADILASDRPSYHGIGALTCSVKDDGEVLLATGMMGGFFTDLRSVEGAEPFIEVCRAEALNPKVKSIDG